MEIVGIIVGGLVFVAMIVAGTIYLVCKRRSKTGSAVHQHTPTFNMPKYADRGQYQGGGT